MQLYHEIHEGQGPYLLLVHGFLSSRAQWGPNLAALARVTRPVVVELWGHARSPSPQDPADYDPDTYIKTFERLREQLGVDRWFVCGQSFGAALTLRYALNYADRVVAQVFTNSSSALADADWVNTRRASARQQAEVIEQGGLDAIENIPVHPARARRLPADVQAALVADAKLHNPQGIARTLRYTTPNVPVRDRVAGLRVPTLLVCGAREKRFATRRQFVEHAIPGLQIVDAPAGHAVNIEAADVFNTAVAAFIQRHMT